MSNSYFKDIFNSIKKDKVKNVNKIIDVLKEIEVRCKIMFLLVPPSLM